jgi:D-arabinose 5-phosphate isomerase GutQ
MTGNAESDLAKKSDFVLWTGSPKEVCPLGLAPTTSTTTMVSQATRPVIMRFATIAGILVKNPSKTLLTWSQQKKAHNWNLDSTLEVGCGNVSQNLRMLAIINSMMP